MSNQAYSRSDDLMVGAGTLYFQREDDTNGWHHLGNVDEFTINNNIETVEKNSSMNKKRELMASVVTAVSPTGSLTMTEYNPYDLALGLFGTEGVHPQTARTYTAEAYVVASVPGIITVVDPDGNRCLNISNVVVAPQTTTPVSFVFTAVPSTVGSFVGTVFTDTEGGTMTLVAPSSYTSPTTTVYISIDAPASPVTGDLDGYTIYVKEGAAGPVQNFSYTTTTTTAQTLPLSSGAQIIVDPSVSSSANGPFTGTGVSPLTSGVTASLTPALTVYTEGRDYNADEQDLRAGIIKIKSGGSIQAGDTVLVSCTIPGNDYVTVSGGDAGDIAGKLLFVGDPNIGGKYVIEAWKVKVTPDGDLTGLIGTDFGTYTLQIRFLADYENHPEYPYYQATLIDRSSGTSAKRGTYNPEY